MYECFAKVANSSCFLSIIIIVITLACKLGLHQPAADDKRTFALSELTYRFVFLPYLYLLFLHAANIRQLSTKLFFQVLLDWMMVLTSPVHNELCSEQINKCTRSRLNSRPKPESRGSRTIIIASTSACNYSSSLQI